MLMTKIPGKTFQVAALALLLLGGGMRSSFAATPETKAAAAPRLAYEHDRLSLNAEMTPLVQLVEEIAAAAGCEIVTASTLYADQLVTADIKDWSVVKVMQALLAGTNYLILFSPDVPRQGLYLLSGTTSAPAGEKLLVLTEEGRRYQPVPGDVPADAKGQAGAGVFARGKAASALPPRLRSPGIMSGRGQKYPFDAMRENLFLPAGVNEKKEEKIDMQTRETSYPEAAAAEKHVTAMNGTDSTFVDDDGEGRAESGDATPPYDSLPDDSDAIPEESADVSFAREDYLRYQIDKLTERIESGYSDRQYEFWSQKRDPKYVTNDRELLARYEQELRAMEDGK